MTHHHAHPAPRRLALATVTALGAALATTLATTLGAATAAPAHPGAAAPTG